METSAEREKISFKPGHRGRAVFLIVTYIFLILLITGICLILKKSRERKKEKIGSVR